MAKVIKMVNPTTKTKKEAKVWADMHELSKEEMYKKYPELIPK